MDRSSVVAIIEKHQSARRPWPVGFPVDSQKACDHFMKLMEPLRKERTAEYWERIAFCLHKFLDLPAKDQSYIIGAIEEGCPWRGDDMSFFIRIYGTFTNGRS